VALGGAGLGHALGQGGQVGVVEFGHGGAGGRVVVGEGLFGGHGTLPLAAGGKGASRA